MKRSMFACAAAALLAVSLSAAPVSAGSWSVANGNASDSTGFSNNRAKAACKGNCSTDTKAKGKVTSVGTTTNAKGVSVSQTSGGSSGVASSSGSMSNSVSGNTTTTP